ncbi:MAG TPA: hypothetical protein VFL04_04950 [Rectinemataceae bacterium]|nr:hypothetical protein [Rectinemataceae bacterium]
MRTAGPVEATFVVAGAGQGQKLRAGALVSVTVLESRSPGSYLVQVGGRRLSASGPAGLQPGSLFRAKVESTPGGLILRAMAPPRQAGAGMAEILARSGLPDDRASRLALTALLGEGLRPQAPALSRVRRAFARAGGEGEESASGSELGRLAARMEAAGLGSEDGILEALAAETGLPSGSGGGGGAQGGDGSGTGPGGGQKTAGRRLELAGDELPAVLGALLRQTVLGSGGEGSLLNLFNHARGAEGSWIYAPFRFELDSVAFSGCFRVKLPLQMGGPGRIEADFEATRRGSEPRTWSLGLAFGGSGRSALGIRANAGRDKALAAADLAGFEADLAASGCSLKLVSDEAGEDPLPASGLELDA